MAGAIRLPPLPSIRDLIRLYKLRALKQLSQNFLLDERITDKIVRAAGKIQNHYVCEVGPGPGGITRSIIRQMPRKLIVVEKDERFLPTLELLQEASRDFVDLKVEIGDIRSYNLEAAFQGCVHRDWTEAPVPIHLIGNLPFNVSTILLVEWLNSISQRKSAWEYGRASMTLTFQKEVAERIVAPITTSARCRLSVMCQLWCDAEHRFTIPGTAFLPKPDVDVGVVTIVPKRYPLVDLPFGLVEKVVRSVFNMRQKFSLRGGQCLFPPEDREELGRKMFHLADVDCTTRPFEIANEEFARICYAYKAICDEKPDLINYNFRGPKRVVSVQV